MKQRPAKTARPKIKKRKLSAVRLFLLVIIFVMIISAVVFSAVFSYRWVEDFLYNSNRNSSIIDPEFNNAKFQNIPYRNIMIVGLDKATKPTERPNVDYLAVLSVAPRGDFPAVVLQIPVKAIVQNSESKQIVSLQQLYAVGGPLSVANTLAKSYLIPVTDYIIVDYIAMTKIIDIAGGIDVFVENNYNYDDLQTATSIHIKSGFQHFDGKSAVDYARFCKDELGDEGRNKRQARMTRELWVKVFAGKNLLHSLELRQMLEKDIVTDMSISRLATTALALIKSDPKTILTFTAPGKYISDKSNLIFKIDEAKFKEIAYSTYYEIKQEGKKQ